MNSLANTLSCASELGRRVKLAQKLIAIATLPFKDQPNAELWAMFEALSFEQQRALVSEYGGFVTSQASDLAEMREAQKIRERGDEIFFGRRKDIGTIESAETEEEALSYVFESLAADYSGSLLFKLRAALRLAGGAQ